mmetsp:Transcript_12957/g.31786  ORF Transcript_12957/g.31786 Transcript_12957/m.31786 type:complete len:143 (-) Transcript_12957:6-434(-)
MASSFQPTVLAGQVALVTGGGSGIGLEIARQLGLHGACVVLMGRREEFLRAAAEALTKEGMKASYAKGDVRSPEDCKRAVAHAVSAFGSLTILVNGAAGNFLATAETLTPKGFNTVMGIDAGGVFAMCHAAFPHLKAGGGGG